MFGSQHTHHTLASTRQAGSQLLAARSVPQLHVKKGSVFASVLPVGFASSLLVSGRDTPHRVRRRPGFSSLRPPNPLSQAYPFLWRVNTFMTTGAPHLEHVGAAPDAAVNEDGHLVAHRLDDVRQHLDGAGRVVQLAAAVVAQHQAVNARLNRQLRVGRRQDALTDTMAVQAPSYMLMSWVAEIAGGT